MACERGMRCILCIEIIVFASLATIMAIRRRDLHHLDAGRLHEAQQPRPIAARRLNADAHRLTEGAHPGEHLAIALTVRGKAAGAQNAITSIDNSGNVKVFWFSTPPMTSAVKLVWLSMAQIPDCVEPLAPPQAAA